MYFCRYGERSRAKTSLGSTRDLQYETAQLRAAMGEWEPSATAWRGALANDPPILVADDDPDIRTLVTAVLRGAGFAVVAARDGAEALALAASHELCAAVLDVFMPRVGGLEVCRALRGGEATSALPILLLSAHGEPDDVARGYEEGASQYMSKPVRPRELVAAVRELVS